MVKTLVSAIALAALPSALAFHNTSPFFLFSTAHLQLPSSAPSLALASEVTRDVLEALQHCPTRSYIIVEQAGVSSTDYTSSFKTPGLIRYMSGEDKHVKSTFAVGDVAQQVNSTTIAKHLQEKCGFDARVNKIQEPGDTYASRTVDLLTADDTLSALIDTEANSENYTVIYITTPTPPHTIHQLMRELEDDHDPPYEMETPFGDNVQMELKRDLSSHVQRANSSNDDAGLFERYQYFTPGIFMGFAAIIPLFLILLVGVRALTSLEVSYFAFSKEMGPNAQRKQ